MFLFFDIDGTLLDYDGKCTEMMCTYLKHLKYKNTIILCTMRPPQAVYSLPLFKYVDGLIASGGAYSEYNDRVLWNVCLMLLD